MPCRDMFVVVVVYHTNVLPAAAVEVMYSDDVFIVLQPGQVLSVITMSVSLFVGWPAVRAMRGLMGVNIVHPAEIQTCL
jgi:hypothetical protein